MERTQPEPPGPPWVLARVLKQDGFGRVELLERGGRRLVRRVACGGRAPLSRTLARALRRREERALGRVADVGRVCGLARDAEAEGLPGPDGRVPRRRDVLLRSWVEGAPLWAAERLPRDFFDRLEELVRALHARGVCHNDLHKENNILVGIDGGPRLIDFQLASVHRAGSRAFAVRSREDLRHVDKHRVRYESRGTTRRSTTRRSTLASAWMRFGKPVYRRLRDALVPAREPEPTRPKAGPWPEWTAPLGGSAGDAGPGGR